MSIRVMAQVWANSTMKGSTLLLQLAIADFADDAGRAFPGVETLSRKIRMSERQTRRLLRLLEDHTEIATAPAGGTHGVNVYIVCPGGVKITPVTMSPRTPVTARGDKSGRLGGTPMTPEPLRNHHEPSQVAIASQDAKTTALLRAGSPALSAWLAEHKP